MSKKTSRSLILGLGQTGLSLFNYLIKFEQEPIIFDTRDDPPCKKKLLKKLQNSKYLFLIDYLKINFLFVRILFDHFS